MHGFVVVVVDSESSGFSANGTSGTTFFVSNGDSPFVVDGSGQNVVASTLESEVLTVESGVVAITISSALAFAIFRRTFPLSVDTGTIFTFSHQFLTVSVGFTTSVARTGIRLNTSFGGFIINGTVNANTARDAVRFAHTEGSLVFGQVHVGAS